MIDLSQVGASATVDAAGDWQVRFGIYLPGITSNNGYELKVRFIHQLDQFVRGIEPLDFDLFWHQGSSLDLWDVTVRVSDHVGHGHFGQEGTYLYRYQLLRSGQVVAMWFGDPFARASGIGTHSAIALDSSAQPFTWHDGTFQVPEVDDMVVYELHVGEFNRTFDGLMLQLDYLWGLGVNVLELMPVTNVKEDVEWGYTPLGFFAPDERFGGPDGMRRLVDACHQRGIAVILDAVYAHAHPEFPYNLVYDATGEDNPMMGHFAGEFFERPGMNYRAAFTREYFFEVNKHWLEEYHLDGFRYDYVPGFYDGPEGQGYANLVHRTYQHSKSIPRFQAPDGRSRLIQCAEHLPDPKGILATTYSNTCWQNALLDKANDMAAHHYVDASFAHSLDPELSGYPVEYTNPAAGDSFPVAPFQYIETHDHSRFITRFAPGQLQDLLEQQYGDREQSYKVQPYIIALYTAKGIPMLWQGQEFGENWGVPYSGLRRNLFRRPLHWEYFYDEHGKALVRLHRIMGTLRRERPALSSRGYFYYYDDSNHLQQDVIVFRRETQPSQGSAGESVLVLLNFSDVEAEVWMPFPYAGTWTEKIDESDNPIPPVDVVQGGDRVPVRVASHYGAVYLKSLP